MTFIAKAEGTIRTMDQETTNTEPKKKFFERTQVRLKSRLHGRVFLIPSLITVVAFFSGFLAIFYALRGNFEDATKCIAIAILFDGLDGRIARKLNATSEFGGEFDSLSDLVAFGVAPALLCYEWAYKIRIDDFGILVAFIYVVCGAARLARFNITSSVEPKRNFDGLPIPGAAAGLCSVVYCFPATIDNAAAVAIVVVYMLLLAGLMISMIPFFSIKHIKLTPKNIRFTMLLLAACVAIGWYHSRTIILLIATGYALSGPIYWLMRNKSIVGRSEAS